MTVDFLMGVVTGASLFVVPIMLTVLVRMIKDDLKAEKTKAFDYLFSKFAGHSNYHGDSILCAIEAVKEGKEIGNVKTMDEAGEQE